MSGPKSGNWCVASNGNGMSFREAKSLLRHYLECIMQYEKQLNALLLRQPELRINKWVDGISEFDYYWPEKISSELNNRYEIYIRLRDELDRVKAEIAERERAAKLEIERQKAYAAMREQAAAFGASSQWHMPSGKKLAETTDKLHVIFDKIYDILDTIDPDADRDERKKIEEYAKDCLSITDIAKAELISTDLRVRISRLNKATREAQQILARKQSEEAAEARQWLLRLGCSNTPAANYLKDDLLKVATGELAISDNIRKAASEAVAESDRNYAGTVLKEALEEFGYEVREGFETVFSNEGSNYFQYPGWGEYHCRVTVDAQKQKVNFNLVRYGGKDHEFMDSAVRDREMEESWCSQVPELMHRLADKGLNIDFTRKIPPGTFAVQQSDDVRLMPSSKKRAKENVMGDYKGLKI